MALQGQNLMNYVGELVNNLDEMKIKKEQLQQQYIEEQEEKVKVEKELQILAERLEQINATLFESFNEKREIEQTIIETENAKNKIAESYKTLLNVLQKNVSKNQKI